MFGLDLTVPAGSNGQIQFNNAGAFGGSPKLNWDGSSVVLTEKAALSFPVGLADPSTAITATAALLAGTIENGDHVYAYTFVDADGDQTAPSADSNTVTTDGTHQRVDLTSIPLGPAGTVSRYIFRRDITQNDPVYWFLTELANNVTTTYQDNTAYAAIGGSPPYVMGSLNTTGGTITSGSEVVRLTPQGLLMPSRWLATAVWPNGPIISAYESPSGYASPFLHYTGVPVIGPSMFFGLNCGNLTNTGDANFGIGYGALPKITTGDSNTAFGLSALANCTSGFENVAVGQSSLILLTTGFENIGIGAASGAHITTGGKNVCIGKETYGPTTGNKWVVIGEDAGSDGSSGDSNILIGVFAGSFNSGSPLTYAVKTGSKNILIGEHTGFVTDGDFSNTIAIGDQCHVDASNHAVIGNADITDVYFGSVAALAKLHAAGYYSADGSAGVTAGPFTAITAITVKNGLVVSLTGS